MRGIGFLPSSKAFLLYPSRVSIPEIEVICLFLAPINDEI